MKQLRYIEIEHFKTFEEKIHIELGHPAVQFALSDVGDRNGRTPSSRRQDQCTDGARPNRPGITQLMLQSDGKRYGIWHIGLEFHL